MATPPSATPTGAASDGGAMANALPATAYNRAMDRIGGGVTYQWGENNQNSITVNVEMLHQP